LSFSYGFTGYSFAKNLNTLNPMENHVLFIQNKQEFFELLNEWEATKKSVQKKEQ
jgi:hypothetical protein